MDAEDAARHALLVWRRSMFLMAVLACAGCGGSHAIDGGGLDGGPDPLDTPYAIEPMPDVPDSGPRDGGPDAESCAGHPRGYTECSVYSRTCCNGLWFQYHDGACGPSLDAGVGDAGSPCDADPTYPGCPCATEGEVACPAFSWRRECTGGVWEDRRPLVCCEVFGL